MEGGKTWKGSKNCQRSGVGVALRQVWAINDGEGGISDYCKENSKINAGADVRDVSHHLRTCECICLCLCLCESKQFATGRIRLRMLIMACWLILSLIISSHPIRGYEQTDFMMKNMGKQPNRIGEDFRG